MFRTVVATQILVVLPFATQAPDPSRLLDYDHAAPVDVKEEGIERRSGISIHDISFASPKGGRVPAYLIVPDGEGPFAAVLWGHWYWENSDFRNRKEFLEEAAAIAPAGVVSLLPDGPVARPGQVQDRTPLNEQQIRDVIQAIVDMRRGADLLLARRDVDPARLAYVGHSYNASVGGYLSGLEKRFAAFVLMAGGLSDASDRETAQVLQFRAKVGADKFDAFAAKYSWLDPGLFVAHAAPAEVFLQYGSQETFLNASRAEAYARVVSDPKRLRIYDAPHALNAEARSDRIAFLVEKLRLKALDPSVIARIPDLPQPPEPSR